MLSIEESALALPGILRPSTRIPSALGTSVSIGEMRA